MGLKLNAKEREVDLLLDTGIYRREALTLAAAVFSRKVEFLVGREEPGSIEVTLRAKGEVSPSELLGQAGEFLNEALNQDLRLDLAKENAGIIKLLMAQALASARGAESPGADPQAEKKLGEEAERLIGESRAGVRK